MALDPSSPRSRRALLTAAVAATAVTVAEAVARPLPVAAANGDPLILGQVNEAILATVLANDDSTVVLDVSTSGWDHEAITGYAPNGVGVHGWSDRGTAIRGDGTGGGSGVVGVSSDGFGVHGASSRHTGVSGLSPTGTGVHAESASGRALDVVGRARFSRSGKATVTAGHLSVTVTVPGGLSGTPLCFANLRSYRSGVAVAAVRTNYPTAGKLRIYLTKTVSRSTSVAWIVMG